MSVRPYSKPWIALSVLVIAALACSIFSPKPTATPTTSATNVPTVSPTPLPPIAPRVIDYTPVRGDELAPDGRITVYFDGPMDKSSVETAFSIKPSVSGQFEWPDPATVQFKPAVALERAARYVVTIQPTAKNNAGLTLPESVSFQADTVGF